MIDGLLVLGVGVVLPLSLGGRWRWWALAAVAVAAGLALPVGPGAAALALPWVVLAVQRTLARRSLAALWAVGASMSLVASRLGVTPFDIHEPIVQLTAVHYTYAGTAALVLAQATGPGRLHNWAVTLTAAAPPIVATGFVLHAAVPQVAGAVLMTFGVWATAVLHLRRAMSEEGLARTLLVVSGLAPWAPMVLAVAWAAGQHWDVPALSIPDMARTHGLLNAVGFSVCGLLALRLTSVPTSTLHPLGR